MKDEQMAAFTKACADIAVCGALDFYRAHKIEGRIPQDQEKIIAEIKATIADAYAVGMKDAKEAFASGMNDVGEATFRASMKLCGINAAKKVSGIDV